MISAIVLARGDSPPSAHARELAARSLSWLVSAVVQGVVRDVTVACPPSWPVDDIMEHAGCTLIQAVREDDRLARAGAAARCPLVLVILVGHQPEGPLAVEIDVLRNRLAQDGAALLLAAPATLLQRLFPNHAAVLGVLSPRGWLLEGPPTSAGPTFAAIARRARRAVRLRTRLVPVL